MQLVAYGAQDIYLTGNPQITFFKVIYRRHTAFSLESIEQTFNGSCDWGKKVTCTVSRNGDLIHRTYLQVELPDVTISPNLAPGVHSTDLAGFRWLNWLGHIMVKSVELEIGGQRIDKHWSTWLHIWNELTQTPGHAVGYANMVGNTSDLTGLTTVAGNASSSVTVKGKTLYIPLQFWFCRNPGLALPLIALQYHEVKINLEFASVTDCYWFSTSTTTGASWSTPSTALMPTSIPYASLYIDYVYLDTEERRRFAQVSHEYLLEQLQFTGEESTSNTNYKVKLNFNHPCKELVWIVQPTSFTDSMNPPTFGKQWFNFSDTAFIDSTAQLSTNWTFLLAGAAGGLGVRQATLVDTGANPTAVAKLQLNGHDRFSEREGSYFNLVQPYQHHSNIPAKGINVYSFALLPEEHQPSGTCNMSRIDNATLQLTLTPQSVVGGSTVVIKVFAINYNVLRIMSGMGGLAYSN